MRAAELVMVAGGFLPAALGHAVGLQCGFKALHSIDGLGQEGRRELDHLCPFPGKHGQKVDFQFSLQQVFTSLAWEHDHDALPQIPQHRTGHRVGYRALVRTQSDTAEDFGEVIHFPQAAQKARAAQRGTIACQRG